MTMSRIDAVAKANELQHEIHQRTADMTPWEFYMTNEQIFAWADICNTDRARFILLDYIRLRAYEENQNDFVAEVVERGEAHCNCGWETCTESWEPGCGLGNDERYVSVVSKEETDTINGIIAKWKEENK
jgi:hypothetical protein